MRISPLRHPLAVLRQLLELNQQQFADLISRSKSTVQAVELCKLPLSEKLAEDISNATGIDPGWLLAGNPASPIRHMNGRQYVQSDFEIWRAEQKIKSLDQPNNKIGTSGSHSSQDREIYGRIFSAILSSAMDAGMTKHAIAKHRIEDFARDMIRDFGISIAASDVSKIIELNYNFNEVFKTIKQSSKNPVVEFRASMRKSEEGSHSEVSSFST